MERALGVSSANIKTSPFNPIKRMEYQLKQAEKAKNNTLFNLNGGN